MLHWELLATHTIRHSIAVEDVKNMFLILKLILNHLKPRCWHVKCLEYAATKHAVCDDMMKYFSVAQADHNIPTLYMAVMYIYI